MAQPASPAKMNGKKDDDQPDDLKQGNQYRGDKNDQADAVRAFPEKIENAVHDGGAVGNTKMLDFHDGQQISRHREDTGGENQGPGAGDAVSLSWMESMAAARAVGAAAGCGVISG